MGPVPVPNRRCRDRHLSRHVPHLGASPYAGFHWQGMADLPALLLGLLFAALALAGAVYLRRYYFEL